MLQDQLNQLAQYPIQGYAIVRGLFSPDEVAFYIDHFMKLREAGSYPGDAAGVEMKGEAAAVDPLKKFPRMIHMHRWDEASLRWLLDERLRQCLNTLLGRDPYAVQTMLYFKPPNSRGQALHQDQYYLRVQPGTCMAAWMALDRCDEANGCMRVVPGSHEFPMLCPQSADVQVSVTDITVPVPAGKTAVPMVMEPGDVLFFNGSVIHGSYPNTTTHRFRRSLIGHYIVGEAEKVAEYFNPVLRMDGSAFTLPASARGGACGVWVDREGRPMVDMSGQLEKVNSAGE